MDNPGNFDDFVDTIEIVKQADLEVFNQPQYRDELEYLRNLCTILIKYVKNNIEACTEIIDCISDEPSSKKQKIDTQKKVDLKCILNTFSKNCQLKIKEAIKTNSDSKFEIPSELFKKNEYIDKFDKCPICLESLLDNYVRLGCTYTKKHKFHMHCILGFAKSPYPFECPQCKTTIQTKHIETIPSNDHAFINSLNEILEEKRSNELTTDDPEIMMLFQDFELPMPIPQPVPPGLPIPQPVPPDFDDDDDDIGLPPLVGGHQ